MRPGIDKSKDQLMGPNFYEILLLSHPSFFVQQIITARNLHTIFLKMNIKYCL